MDEPTPIMDAHRPRRRQLLLGLATAAALALSSTPAAASTAAISFTPAVDTYVDASHADTSYGSATSFWVDSSPKRHAYLRFEVEGLDGRTVVGARLRLYQADNSTFGGRVFSASSTAWPEEMTWNTRPSIDGPQRGTFGAVAKGHYYEADLGPVVSSDGAVTLAIDSTSRDGARWSSREAGMKAPRLILEVEPGDQIIDGLSRIADPVVGSSESTYYGMQHRLAVTEAGRLLAIHGVHATGPQLVWRDPAGNWQTQTTGDVENGDLIPPSKTGDWPTSIAIAPDSEGVEHAWVVFGASNYSLAKPVYLRRLSNLDSPNGPRVGPLVVVDPAPAGGYKPDIEFEQTPSGVTRAALVWARRTSEGGYEMVSGWLTDLDTDTPAIQNQTVRYSSTSSSAIFGTLVSTATGMRIVARSGSRLVLYRRGFEDPLGAWTKGPSGIATHIYSYQSATALDSGEVLAAVESDVTNHVVKVQRYSAAGIAAPIELTLEGYAQPSIASDGVNAWLVMIRQSDGYVVSRGFTPATGWDAVDRVEIGAEGGGSYGNPNLLRRTDGRLRLIVRGPRPPGSTAKSSVLAYQRGL